MNNKSNKKRKAGFALLELILVVVIVVALGSVGVSKVAETKKNVKQKELDSYAQTLLSAIEKRFTELTSSGQIDQIQSIGNAFPEGFIPYGFEQDGTPDFDASQMKFLVLDEMSDKNNLKLKGVDEELMAGRWVVEYNQFSGSVYSVFYSENGFPVDTASANLPKLLDDYREFSYRRGRGVGYAGGYYSVVNLTGQNLQPKVSFEPIDSTYVNWGIVFRCTLPADMYTYDEDGKITGARDKIVYDYEITKPGSDPTYNKTGLTSAVTKKDANGNDDFYFVIPFEDIALEEGQTVRVSLKARGANLKTSSETDIGEYIYAESAGQVDFSVSNKEELVIESKAIANKDAEYLNFYYIFEELDSKNKVAETAVRVVTVKTTQAAVGNPDKVEFVNKYIVDSLTSSAMQFKSVLPNFTPGCNVQLRVVTSYENREDTEPVVFNSLFANGSDGTTAYIGYGRHLQNLENTVSNVSSAYTAGVLISDISFEEKNSEWYNAYGNTKFKSINNSNVTALSSSGTAIYAIKNINIYNKSGYVGLFGTFSNNTKNITKTISNINLVSPTITGKHAGGFIGRVTNRTVCISNCKVIDGKINGSSNAGGLIGLVSTTTQIDNCYVVVENPASSKNWDGVKAAWNITGGNAGGLVGCSEYCNNVSITSCAAAVVVNGSNNAGGLVGCMETRIDSGKDTRLFTISKSYSDSYVIGGNAGGLIGYKCNITGSNVIGAVNCVIENCYAAGYLNGSNSEGGFVAKIDDDDTTINNYANDLTIKNSYTICKPSNNEIAYKVAARYSADNVWYLFNGALAGTSDESLKAIENNTGAASLNKDLFETGKPTKVYNYLNQGLKTSDNYDYLKLKDLDHYGDWAHVKTYTVIFDANNGTNEKKEQKFIAGEEQKLSANTFKKEGYEFLGWSKSKDSEEAEYKDGASVKDLTDKDSIILYAVWGKKKAGIATGFVYYEVYTDGSVGFYFADGRASTLSDSAVVIGDGYGMILNVDEKDEIVDIENKVKINCLYGKLDTTNNTFTLSSYDVRTNSFKIGNGQSGNGFVKTLSDGAVLYGFDKTYLNPLNAGKITDNGLEFYTEINITYGEESLHYYYTPFYAKGIYSTKPTNSAGTEIAIRSPRQLLALSHLYPQYMTVTNTTQQAEDKQFTYNITFSQELDIDYFDYEWDKHTSIAGRNGFYNTVGGQYPIGIECDTFRSNYNGNYHFIKNIKFKGIKRDGCYITLSGLFGWVNGSEDSTNISHIQNTFIVNTKLTGEYADHAYIKNASVVGGFVGRVENACIENCGVSGYTIYVDKSKTTDAVFSGSYHSKGAQIGGFAASMYKGAIIRNCQAENMTIQVICSDTSARFSIGGFVGLMDQESEASLRPQALTCVANTTFKGGCKSTNFRVAGFTTTISGSWFNVDQENQNNWYVASTNQQIVRNCYCFMKYDSVTLTDDSGYQGKFVNGSYGWISKNDSQGGARNCYVLDSSAGLYGYYPGNIYNNNKSAFDNAVTKMGGYGIHKVSTIDEVSIEGMSKSSGLVTVLKSTKDSTSADLYLTRVTQ